MIRLAQPKTLQVQFIGLSGQTESGLYAIDHAQVRYQHQDVSLLVRVLAKHHTCSPEIIIDHVYVCANPYNFETIDTPDGQYLIMGEDNLLCEMVGYDADAQQIADEQDAEAYPICGKC